MIKNIAILLSSCWFLLVSCRSVRASDDWHVGATPKIITQEMQFSNGEIRLSGTVYLPEHGDHLPAVVALHGASDATRGSGLFQHLREGLPLLGVAVLIYDRRGSGKSSGSLKNIDYETLAKDAIAGQRALATLPRIDPHKIGFWGLSQGGWLALLAVSRNRDTAFAIAVSAPLVTPEQQMEFAAANLLTIRGYSQADVQQMLETRKAWVAYLSGENSRDTATEALRRAETQPWFDLAFVPKAPALTTDPKHNSWSREMNADFVAAVRDVSAPILFIYGGADPWIPVAQSIKEIEVLLKRQSNIQYAIIADADHEMMVNPHETMAFDEKTWNESKPQAPAYFMLLASWLCQQVGK